MKKILLLFIVFFMVGMFCSCSLLKTDADNAEQDQAMLMNAGADENGISSYSEEDDALYFCGMVVEVNDDSLILIHGGKNPKDSSVYKLPLNGVKMTDSDGNGVQSEIFRVGSLIEVKYGEVSDGFPKVFDNPESICFITQEDTVVSVYASAIQSLYGLGTGYSYSIETIAIDMSGVGNMKQKDINAVEYLLERSLGCDVIQATYDELKSTGYIDPETETFTDGLLFTVSSIGDELQNELGEKSFKFEISKWHSDMDVYGYSECVAECMDGEWTFMAGMLWAS